MKASWGPGTIAAAVHLSFENRVMQFVIDEESEPMQFFSDEMRSHSKSGDWYGEHAGKWLVTAGHAWRRTQSTELKSRIERVVGYLAAQQETDGYLGTYATEYEGRLTSGDAANVRTWDLWIHAWLILGLLEVSEVVAEATNTAKRIGDLILREFGNGKKSVLDLGNHQGLSSAVLVQPLAELTLRTGDPAYAAFAREILQQMEDRGLPILSGADRDLDISEVGTGKSYQICWILVGLTALYRATGEDLPQRAAEYWWENISQHHLTPMGGPWGGIGTHKEVFNAQGFFSPHGLTETCSTASWMALCRELFLLTDETRFIDAFETSLMNALLGAMDENGQDWCYFTFPNGRRNNTYHWACCKSSGAMALEEALAMAGSVSNNGVDVHLWQSLTLQGPIKDQRVVCRQAIRRDDQEAEITLELEQDAEFELTLRLPKGSCLLSVSVNGEPPEHLVQSDGRLRLVGSWKDGDVVVVQTKFLLKVTPETFTLDHHGQEVVRTDYAHLSWGPYVYATGLIDGYKKEETLRLARLTPEAPFVVGSSWTAYGLPIIQFVQPGRPPIPFAPYFEAGGRHDGAWRAVWMQVAWQ